MKQDSTAADQERRVAEALAEEYRKQGYNVVRQPSALDTPEVLRPYQPDLILTKGDEKWVVEVKMPGHKRPQSNFADLAEKATRAGWRFRFVIAEGGEGDIRSYTLPNTAEIQAGLETSARLAAAGQGAASLLFAWSLFEAAARSRLLRDNQDPGRAVTPVGLAKALVHFGHLDESELEQLQDIAHLRNQVAHGLFQAIVPPDAINLLSALTRRMLVADAASEQALLQS